MDKTALLKEKIADAEVVLIGIGEEFNERFDNISDHSQLLEGLNKVDENEGLSWLVPFFEKIYLVIDFISVFIGKFEDSFHSVII